MGGPRDELAEYRFLHCEDLQGRRKYRRPRPAFFVAAHLSFNGHLAKVSGLRGGCACAFRSLFAHVPLLFLTTFLQPGDGFWRLFPESAASLLVFAAVLLSCLHLLLQRVAWCAGDGQGPRHRFLRRSYIVSNPSQSRAT